MIHVKLHLGDDTAKIRHKATKDCRFVHPAQHGFGIALAGQDIEEQGVCARIIANFRIDQLGIAIGSAHRLGMNLQPMLVCERENLDQPNGIARKPVVSR